MNPDNRRDDIHEDEKFTQLFGALEQDAPPIDEAMREHLLSEATDLFVADNPTTPSTSRRRRKMLNYGFRALAATTLIIGICLYAMLTAGDPSTQFGQVLDNLAKVETAELEVIHSGHKSKVWAANPGRLRVETEEKDVYTIARDATMWKVDERENRASSSPSPYFHEGKGSVDMLALIDLSDDEYHKQLAAIQPSKKIKLDGDDFLVYKLDLPSADTKTSVQIEAIAWADNLMLRSLKATRIRKGHDPTIDQINVISTGDPIEEAKFVVGDTLTEDGRIGKIVDAQGIVAVKPPMQSRFTPVSGSLLLRPGDWVRTDVRGANACALRLMRDTAVTLGPGSLVELLSPREIRVQSGTIKVKTEEGAPITLIAPNTERVKVDGEVVYLVKDEKLERLEATPKWLAGFESATADQSIGSLVVNVDGRDLPLTVGYHKVTVDIRDQIARTVIEESFVNHTDSRLEGVFYFPLPADASISGFGMWIGDELVEADIVEKQRAREIYETILREKRDPGLLEWAGGNMFKARVFPILAHSEKRVKITYTQVLPLRGNSYRYSYALLSEMLKQHPLRELAIDVKVSSARPLAAVSSPTHSTARVAKTNNSAHVEFTAQEFTPTRDFEVVVETQGAGSEVVMIPHRRGDDGYFMAMIAPPAAQGEKLREVLPDGEPLRLLLLADTSASLSVEDRETQAEFIATLLGSLTSKDIFNLAVCDVDTTWIFKQPQPATEENIKAARDLLAARRSLGWTDLDRAFASAVKQSNQKTHVIYIGDGVSTTGNADPVAQANRLRFSCEGKTAGMHAVSVGSSYESVVMKAIGSIGAGSSRAISGTTGPQTTAVELLGEIVRPTLREMKVEFEGIRTAFVYPTELPNLPAGAQHIVIGRYLPEGADQTGRVIVSAMQGDRPIRMTTPVTLADAESGNSFIPRLWARKHLDWLLEQGSTPQVKEDIITMSEEFHIITPYTSLLVLESDEDRERFGVKRRFQMRDGERFFADGRDNANYELLQQQMRQAGTWRLGLRRSVLSDLVGLGRGAINIPIPEYYDITDGRDINGRFGRRLSGDVNYEYAAHGSMGGSSYLGSGFDSRLSSKTESLSMMATPHIIIHEESKKDLSWNRPLNGSGTDMLFAAGDKQLAESREEWFAEPMASSGPVADFRFQRLEKSSDILASYETADYRSNVLGQDYDRTIVNDLQAEGVFSADLDISFTNSLSSSMREKKNKGYGLIRGGGGYLYDGEVIAGNRAALKSRKSISDYHWRGDERYAGNELAKALRRPVPSGSWVDQLYPSIPASTSEPAPLGKRWPAEVRRLAESLLRNDTLAKIKTGLEIVSESESINTRWNETSSKSRSVALIGPNRWLARIESDRAEPKLHWCDGKKRGILNLAILLGRTRDASKRDEITSLLSMPGPIFSSLERSYTVYTPSIEKESDERSVLILKHDNSPDYEIRYTIDTARDVVLRVEHRNKGEVSSATVFSDFVEAAGRYWATRVESFAGEGKLTSRTKIHFTEMNDDLFDDRYDEETVRLADANLLREPLPTVDEAKKKIAAGQAEYEDYLTVAWHFTLSQQWGRVIEQLDLFEKAAGEKSCLRWLRYEMLRQSRRGEEMKLQLLDEAKLLASMQDHNQFAGDLSLGQRIVNMANGNLSYAEMLDLYDRLMPVYKRQPSYLEAMKQWKQWRAYALQSASRQNEAFELWKELANEYSRDYSLQQNYANQLRNIGETEAALQWLDRVIERSTKWLPYERDSLRSTYVQLLRNQGRYPEMVEYFASWMTEDLTSESPYNQYLTALIRMDEDKKADELIGRWIADGISGDLTDQPRLARLQASLSHARGQGYNVYTNRVEAKWHQLLADAAWKLALHKTYGYLADQIVGSQFNSTDACRELRRKAVRTLVKDYDKLDFAQVQRLVNWAMHNDPVVEREDWKKIAALIKKSWRAEKEDDKKNQWAALAGRVISSRIGQDEQLAFVREKIEEGPKKYRTMYRNELFNLLLGRLWTADQEEEAFALLDKLTDSEDATAQLVSQIQALLRLNNAIIRQRYADLMRGVEHQEDLTREELFEMQKKNIRLAREGLAERLVKLTAQCSDDLRPWVQVERIYLDVQLDRDLKLVTEDCWELLGPNPPEPIKIDEDTTIDPKIVIRSLLDARVLTMLMNFAARQSAEPEQVGRLLAYLDKAIERNPKNDFWKMKKYQMLIALDRPADLEKQLREWISVEKPLAGWRISLANLLAEQGKIAEAVKLFEAVEKADELLPQQYKMLADWYLVLDRREDYERVKIAMYQVMQEYQMRNWIQQKLNRWQNNSGDMPTELDEEVLLVFRALFAKSSSPSSHLYLVRQFYRETRDFRLLAGLADATIGHTSGFVYSMLGGMSSVLSEIREEATVDDMVARINILRERELTTVDRRALDLFETLAERRAAELINQPGPHAERAIAALGRAFTHQWSKGEPRLYADLLCNMGRIAEPRLAALQRDQLKELFDSAEPGSSDRLQIALDYANTLWNYSMHTEAIDLLVSALDENRKANDGIMPYESRSTFERLISMYESRRYYAQGEQAIKAEQIRPVNADQGRWLDRRLYELYNHAIQGEGTVSLGSGSTLYQNVERQLREEIQKLKHSDSNHRQNMVSTLCYIYRSAKNKHYNSAEDDLRHFAFDEVPGLLVRSTDYHNSTLQYVADALHDVCGSRDGLAFLIERIEQEPQWLRHTGNDGWSRHSYRLGYWRSKTKDLGDLAPRLLAIVIKELKADLRTQRSRNRYMYRKHHSYYWPEKEADFARAADEVLAEKADSFAAVKYIAEYLFYGIEHYARGIEVLLDANRREVLDESGKWTLVSYLHHQSRYGESIAILEPLVAKNDGNLSYRTALMLAYAKTQQKQRLMELLEDTDKYFHAKDRWQEDVIAQLARSCKDCDLYEEAVAYFEEVIPLHQRTQPNRGIGNGTLSYYYRDMAECYARLNNTAKAVDAASGAIVSWGPRSDNRQDALNSLVNVLRRSPDIDAYIAILDAEVEKSGLENPIVRKAIGQALKDQGKFDGAIVQLKLAVEVQPNDTETHRLLIDCYDRMKDADGALRQMHEAVRLSRRDIKLYEDLGRRYESLKMPEQAERAYTSIVEMLPTESESHTQLAEIRQRQNRWDQAAAHWRRVADIRSLEPTGLLKLAAALIHEKRWDEATATIKQLHRKVWPSRFGNVDYEIRQLERQIDNARDK